MLIIMSGLPGTGKTTISRALAQCLGAMHLRIDSIEQAIEATGILSGPMNDAGYRVAHAVCEDNLALGLTVVADCVNALGVTRSAWREVGRRAGVGSIDVEIVCSDPAEHRRRLETRDAGLRRVTWEQVLSREYNPWDRERLIVDTARTRVDEAIAAIRAAVDHRCG